ncbi:hypothetical protein LEP1GSC047_1102 [Leptospira inadai serovar Lyme str. 10]|uniref:Uncharacterized protein n=1 Tax=Leptospira inadai serovar Lyme str. 10 TaxID=1049790 RepID=V6HRY0_9LEPT|nr:hypothetical protein LEP1GSC047_1102 [Leptospira inadai serovar Lyme str. 10]
MPKFGRSKRVFGSEIYFQVPGFWRQNKFRARTFLGIRFVPLESFFFVFFLPIRAGKPDIQFSIFLYRIVNFDCCR